MNFVTEEMINPYRYMCKQTLFHLLFQCQRRKNPGSAGNPAVGPAQLVMKAVQGLWGGGLGVKRCWVLALSQPHSGGCVTLNEIPLKCAGAPISQMESGGRQGRVTSPGSRSCPDPGASFQLVTGDGDGFAAYHLRHAARLRSRSCVLGSH